MTIVVSPEAVADLDRLRDFLAGKNQQAAERAVSALIQAIESLNSNPDRGRPSDVPGARELVVPFGRSAYIVRYAHRTRADEVVILRIWHARESRG